MPSSGPETFDVLKNWRAWVLGVLFFGPILAYIGLGALWLAERSGPLGLRGEWLYYGSGAWVVTGILFAVLANRWTKSSRRLLPPIDWDAPQTFSPLDRRAWELVQEEAERGDTISLQELTAIDVYIETGRRLARRVAAHYHPEAGDPLEHVPVVEVITALELAAEDLEALCREIPGGDLITPSHWKKAVQAAGYLQRANEIYSYLLPVFQPVTGLVRLGSQKLMVQPAWRNMQQNLLRWFYRAFVNRLGMHLIELYSGRLAIGAQQYRRLTRKHSGLPTPTEESSEPLVIGVIGRRDAPIDTLRDVLEKARGLAPPAPHAINGRVGADPSRLRTARVEALPAYPSPGERGESSRDRSSRADAAAAVMDVDLLLLVIPAERTEIEPDLKFLATLKELIDADPNVEIPPIVAVVAPSDAPDSQTGHGDPAQVLAAIRGLLPTTVLDAVALRLEVNEVARTLLPELAEVLPRAERIALLRQLHRLGRRSKARRLVSQLGRGGRRLWDRIQTRHE